jgi:ankyrin repeat protein
MSLTRTLRHGLLLLGAALCATPALARTARDAPVPARGKFCQDLFQAVGRGDVAGLSALLRRGADPNARNNLEMTPLMIAATTGRIPVVEALLRGGAKLEAWSIFGTPLTFAAMTGQAEIARFLLDRHADVGARRPDGITVLMMAARSGAPEIVRDLLGRKADVNAKDADGATALIYAAREGDMEAGRLLLNGGAAVDAADSHRRTALSYAAVNGHAEFVKLLLEKGANVNARDQRGRTPLLLTASYGDYPDVIRALLDGGADIRATGAKSGTALALAAARGRTETAQLLRERGADPVATVGETAPRTPREAIQTSLPLLQRSMRVFLQNTGCVSCHQEGLGRMATGAARQHGFAIDEAVARGQLQRMCGALNQLRPLHLKALKDPNVMKTVPLIEIQEVSPSYTFFLAGLVAHRQPANEAISAATQVLARQQLPDGHWQFALRRVPMQSSYFTTTALAVQAIQAYAPKGAERAERLRHAREWLLTAPTETGEDRSFRLLGLKWAGASQDQRRKAVDELRAEQRPDGGWAQLASLQSDAYATGQALYSLQVAGGLPVTDPVYQRGMQFLLRTQEEDGSWFVSKRAMPANNYFDSTFPHGESQYASFNATCWATMALLQTIDAPRPGPQHAARRDARASSPRGAGFAHR